MWRKQLVQAVLDNFPLMVQMSQQLGWMLNLQESELELSHYLKATQPRKFLVQKMIQSICFDILILQSRSCLPLSSCLRNMGLWVTLFEAVHCL